MLKEIERLANRESRAPGDYTENGLLMCGKCRTPKQKAQLFPGKDGTKNERLVPISCRCEAESLERERDEKEMQDFRARMHGLQERFHISDEAYRRFNFQMDDRQNAKVSNICRGYVDRWPEMKQNRMGILLFGSVGTGKSFYACAIVNALLDQKVSATVTNFPRLLNILQGVRDKQECIDHLQNYQLLVIDDLGTERDSAYGAEQIFNVLDTRERSELPLIVTTNMSLEEMENPADMRLARIYDRVLRLCNIKLVMTGESRRVGDAKRRAELARELLKGY